MTNEFKHALRELKHSIAYHEEMLKGNELCDEMREYAMGKISAYNDAIVIILDALARCDQDGKGDKCDKCAVLSSDADLKQMRLMYKIKHGISLGRLGD